MSTLLLGLYDLLSVWPFTRPHLFCSLLGSNTCTALCIDLAMTKQKALESDLICDTWNQKLCLHSVLWLCNYDASYLQILQGQYKVLYMY